MKTLGIFLIGFLAAAGGVAAAAYVAKKKFERENEDDYFDAWDDEDDEDWDFDFDDENTLEGADDAIEEEETSAHVKSVFTEEPKDDISDEEL